MKVLKQTDLQKAEEARKEQERKDKLVDELKAKNEQLEKSQAELQEAINFLLLNA